MNAFSEWLRNRWSLRFVSLSLAVILASLGAGAQEAEKVRLEYGSWYTSPGQMAIEEEVIRLFNESQDRIEVSFRGYVGDIGEYLAVQIAAGTPPDIAAVPAANFADIIDQIAIDLAPYVEADGFDMSQFRSQQTYLWQRNGRIYGVPWGFGLNFLVYNKDFFDEHGLVHPYKGWTIEEFLDAARRFTQDLNGDGEPDTFGVHDPSHFYMWSAAYGENYVDGDTGELRITTPGFLQGLDLYRSFFWEHGIVGGSYFDGTAGMHFRFEGQIGGDIQSGLHETINWGTGWYPRLPGGDVLTLGGGHIMSVMTTTAHPQAAWEFVKFYNSPQAQAVFGRRSLYPSTRVGAEYMVAESVVPPGYDREELFRPIFDPGTIVENPFHIPGAGRVHVELFDVVGREIRDLGRLPALVMSEIAPLMQAILDEAKR